jgi:hypothetical protein
MSSIAASSCGGEPTYLIRSSRTRSSRLGEEWLASCLAAARADLAGFGCARGARMATRSSSG